MKLLKKVTALLLSVILVFSCFAVSGFTASTLKSLKIVQLPNKTTFYRGEDWDYGYWRFDPDFEKMGKFVARDDLICFMHNGGYYSHYEDLGMIDMTGLIVEATYSNGLKLNVEYQEFVNGISATQNIYASPQKKLTAGKNVIEVYFLEDRSVYATYEINLADKAPVSLKGDVNGDSKVNSADALLILQHVVGMKQLTSKQIGIADLTKDGIINSADALDVLLIAVGKKK